MSDEQNTQPAPEPTLQTPTEQEVIPQPEPTPETTENQISESTNAPVSSGEPTAEASLPPIESVPAPEPSVAPETPQSPEGAILDKDQNPANEPFESPPVPENVPIPNNPNITVEKHGNDVTITEVMKPEPEPKTETAQMAGNEPFDKTQDKSIDLSEEIKTKQRQKNLKLANEKRQEKKREKINEILNLFDERQNITNDEVEKLLHVSDATATRYLETLEKEGKIKQVGKTGKGVTYEKI